MMMSKSYVKIKIQLSFEIKLFVYNNSLFFSIWYVQSYVVDSIGLKLSCWNKQSLKLGTYLQLHKQVPI